MGRWPIHTQSLPPVAKAFCTKSLMWPLRHGVFLYWISHKKNNLELLSTTSGSDTAKAVVLWGWLSRAGFGGMFLVASRALWRDGAIPWHSASAQTNHGVKQSPSLPLPAPSPLIISAHQCFGWPNKQDYALPVPVKSQLYGDPISGWQRCGHSQAGD